MGGGISMEELVDAEANAETSIEETIVEKSSSSLSLTKRIADPVVYQLVRVNIFHLSNLFVLAFSVDLVAMLIRL